VEIHPEGIQRKRRCLAGGTGASGASGGIFNFFLTFPPSDSSLAP